MLDNGLIFVCTFLRVARSALIYGRKVVVGLIIFVTVVISPPVMDYGYDSSCRKLIDPRLHILGFKIKLFDLLLENPVAAISYSYHTYLRESVLDQEEALARRGAGHSRVKYLRLYVILHY